MELIVIDVWEFMRSDFYLQVQQGKKLVIIGYDGSNLIDQEIKEAEPYKKFKPLLSVPMSMKSDVLKAFGLFINKEKIEILDESELKGRLNSAEKHLEDVSSTMHQLLDFVTNKKVKR
jgi:hypothetical protein